MPKSSVSSLRFSKLRLCAKAAPAYLRAAWKPPGRGHPRHHADTGNGQNPGQQKQAAYAHRVGNHRGNDEADRNVRPILKPIIAIARVRTPSRVKSASSAVTAALTAPAPCMARAAISMGSVSAAAARKLPAANTISPHKWFSCARTCRKRCPKQLQQSLCQPVNAHCQPDQRFVALPRRAARRHTPPIRAARGTYPAYAARTRRKASYWCAIRAETFGCGCLLPSYFFRRHQQLQCRLNFQ